ncbi:S8 family serine peptidase [Paenibacillus polymyxa]|uniref:S8 family serine peptidase n=1 Tax=Paenibacillus polymyxa TaxID=1406 RepID=UPI002025A065|nr:S8 family serine peptidase [Paenibacillus polymyxa]URJ59974.1 S8 family serine peptidase [Paenibacillus polymyxa]
MIQNNTYALRPVKIVVLDSGIDIDKGGLVEHVKESIHFSLDNNGIVLEKKQYSYNNDHGTAVAMAIKHITPNVEFISMNILNEQLRSDGRVLLHAFKRAIDCSPDIIHMSLGTKKFRYAKPLKKLACEAREHEVFVVAAANNKVRSLPARLKNVIGVLGLSNLNPEHYCFNNKYFYACDNVNNVRRIGEIPNYKFLTGSSIAAAFISGHIARLISKRNFRFDEINSLLKKEIMGGEI